MRVYWVFLENDMQKINIIMLCLKYIFYYGNEQCVVGEMQFDFGIEGEWNVYDG